jgi:dihydrofolate reductase
LDNVQKGFFFVVIAHYFYAVTPYNYPASPVTLQVLYPFILKKPDWHNFIKKLLKMNKLSVFNFITLNGFYKGVNEDTGWHKHDDEGSEFSAENLKAGNTLLFGRVTYEMMAGFWPTDMAYGMFPEVAKGMNSAEKVVFSTTLKTAGWHNTTLIKENIIEAVRDMKTQPGNNLTVLGSGSIITQLAEHGLIDEYQFMFDPIAIGKGTPVFNNINKPLNLKLTSSRTFKSGSILLCYEPVR